MQSEIEKKKNPDAPRASMENNFRPNNFTTSELLKEILSKLDDVKRVKDGFMARCVFHAEHTPSLHIFENGGFYCFGCGESGGIYRLAEEVGIEVKPQATRNEIEHFKGYIAKRLGITPDEVLKASQALGIYADDTNSLKLRLSSPDGRFLFFIKHHIDREPKYQFPEGAGPKGKLFGLDRALSLEKIYRARLGKVDLSKDNLRKLKENIILVEGYFDALCLLWQGIPAAATMGGANRDPKLVHKLLARHGIKNVVLAFDNDDTGRDFSRDYLKYFVSRPEIYPRVCFIEGYKDINDGVKEEGIKFLDKINPVSPLDAFVKLYNIQERLKQGDNERHSALVDLSNFYRSMSPAFQEREDLNELGNKLGLTQAERESFLYIDSNVFRSAVTENGGIRLTKLIERVVRSSLIKNIYFDMSLKSFYQWTGNHFKMLDDLELKRIIQDAANREGVILTATHLNNLVESLKTLKSYIPQVPKPKSVIPLLNGVLEVEAEVGKVNFYLIDHDPQNGNKYVFPVEYDPNAEAPVWKEFIESLELSEKSRDLLQEYLGYMLLPLDVLNHQKALILYGEGSNGKNTIANTIYKLLGGPATCSTLRVDELSGFKLSSLIDKVANIGTEITSSGKFIDTQVFKAVIAGDPLTIDIKFKEPVSYSPKAKHLYTVNALPTVSDTSIGFFRRLLIIRFNRVFSEKEQNERLPKLLEKELSGILNWLLEGLERLLINGRFTENESKQVIRTYYEDTNHVYKWLKEGAVIDKDAFTPNDELYKSYKEWTLDNGFRPNSRTNFIRELKRILSTIHDSELEGIKEARKNYDGEKPRGFLGIRPLKYS